MKSLRSHRRAPPLINTHTNKFRFRSNRLTLTPCPSLAHNPTSRSVKPLLLRHALSLPLPHPIPKQLRKPGQTLIFAPVDDANVVALFAAFDVNAARCALERDAHALKAVVEATFGDLAEFNAAMRGLPTKSLESG